MIVLSIFTSGIGNLACKGNVLPDMTRYIYPSFYIGIIIPSRLILPIHPLLHRPFQERREQVNKEVKNTLFVRVELQIKQIDGKYLSEHVVQEVVIAILSKARTDANLCIATPNKAHDVTRNNLFTFHLKDMSITYLIPIDIQVLWEYQQIGMLLTA